MKKCIVSCALIVLPLLSLAQYIVSGKVYNNQNKTLTGVTVHIEKTWLATSTDAGGSYVLNNLKPQALRLKFSSIGLRDSLVVFELTGDTVINIVLLPKAYITDEVLVTATRAGEKSGFNFTDLNKAEIEKYNYAKDVPFILNTLPSVTVTSDAGNGTGYTGIRIRGSDATRINVTINGIPVNDAESQGMYWVDLPDIAASAENIQVQCGAGTSTNGASAFGGSINILTEDFNPLPYAKSSASYGSFNTLKTNVSASTGLLSNHWTVKTRLSRITSDGYIDRATSDLKSFYFSAGYQSKKTLVKAIVFSGKEITYQSWNGIPEARLKNDDAGISDFISRNYLDDEDAANLLSSGRTYNYFTYKNQVDDYRQDYYQLHFSQQLSAKINLNLAGHYTKGQGYYEEYKKNEAFASYGLANVISGIDTLTTTKLVRQKWLDNDFYGITWSLNYENRKNLKSILGGAWNQYAGDHFHKIIWAQHASNSFIGDNYYSDDALKTDFTVFAKNTYDVTASFSVFTDIQFRSVVYAFNGPDEFLALVPRNETLTLFNPKAGIAYTFNNIHATYVSVSRAAKEPSRDDYIFSTAASKPKPEEMTDFEFGYSLKLKKLLSRINFYYMDYENQLALTGQINDVGNYTRSNIDKSYRAGVETELSIRVIEKLLLTGNVTYSQNKISSFKEYIDNYDDYTQQENKYENTDIAFSPRLISFAAVEWNPFNGFSCSVNFKYVGEQYLDNTENSGRMLSAFFTNDLHAGYTLKTKFLKEITLSIAAYNIADQLYESNGYTYSYISGQKIITENFYYPQAGRHYAARLSLSF